MKCPAIPAQGEPVAPAFNPQNVRAWMLATPFTQCSEWAAYVSHMTESLAALPSSPAPNRNCPKCGDAFPCKCVSYGSPVPDASPLNSGECEPVVKSASGAGEAIFAECAEIALEHVGARRRPIASDSSEAYDEACREIAEAIRTRASNRKTMDGLVKS